MDSEIKAVIGLVLFCGIVIVPACTVDSYFKNRAKAETAKACINRGGSWIYNGPTNSNCVVR